ncbi:surface lipoprotein assembly modifier [Yoonia sp.]|uniref:surface lipoprotein assembly modifier n=1 Tax=Yoonia sp. TaxID=2212373 RepID=UPI003F6D5DF1
MNKWIFALAIGLFGSFASAQTTLTLSLDDARAIAVQAFRAGEEDTALQIAERLLQANPDDRTALVIVAALADPATGRKAGARAWALSDTNTQRYEAARLTALAAAREERFTLATLWLRRALTVAPNETETARTTQDAARLRRLNPWSNSLSFALVPSNNVNGGAEDEILTAPGLPDGTLSPDAQALAGVRAVLGLRSQYRLTQTEKSRATVAIGVQASRVRLENGQNTANISGRDFATDAADISLGYDRILENGSFGGRLTFGTYDFGREDYYDFRRLSLARTVPLSDKTGLQLSATHERQTYVQTGIGTIDRTILRSSVTQQLDNKDRIGATLTYTQSDGDSVNYTYEDWSLAGSYAWAEPFGPVTLGISAGIKWSDYPAYTVLIPVDGGREDQTFFYTINMGFDDLSYAGFTPGLTISGSVADSNISRFTRNTTSFGLTLNSTF